MNVAIFSVFLLSRDHLWRLYIIGALFLSIGKDFIM